MGVEGAKAISNPPKTNTMSTKLDLYGSNIGDQGLKTIGETLIRLPEESRFLRLL